MAVGTMSDGYERGKGAKRSAAGGTAAGKRSIRILVVEDNVINQIFMRKVLEDKGYFVETVPDGQEAVEILVKRPFTLVLMDVDMPVMDGLEATRRIRSHSSNVLNPRIPIIALTAYAMEGDREKCLKAGMVDYISKPVLAEELLRVVRAWHHMDEEEAGM
ncbi:MAG: response regulator [Planctomycetota bacterium]|jgi:CheY-like chemotaxis protein